MNFSSQQPQMYTLPSITDAPKMLSSEEVSTLSQNGDTLTTLTINNKDQLLTVGKLGIVKTSEKMWKGLGSKELQYNLFTIHKLRKNEMVDIIVNKADGRKKLFKCNVLFLQNNSYVTST